MDGPVGVEGRTVAARDFVYGVRSEVRRRGEFRFGQDVA